MVRKITPLINRFREVTAERLMRHVRVLASDELRGRMPGDIGYRKAMDYSINFFQQHGLQPGFADKGYEQAFTMETCRIVSAGVTMTVIESEPERLKLGTDFICRGLTGNGHVSGDLVFVGYCSEESDFDELTGLDLEGKIAVSFKHSPPWRTDQSPVLPRQKAHQLAARGARGLVIIPNPNRKEQDRLSGSLVEKGDYIPGFPMIVLAEHQAERLFCGGDDTLSARQFRIDANRDVMSGPLPVRMSIRITTDYNPAGVSWNAAAFLPGIDPDLSRESIIIGAHMDHVGIQGEKIIFNGAQDNASGAAAVIELARIFAEGDRPARSLQFVLFGAEEAGLLGSLYYAEHPSLPLESTRAMLNLDCMGAGDGVDMRGREAYPRLFEIFDALNDEFVHMPGTKENHPPGGADAKPFEDAGIPNMYFVGSNPYRHLHMISDTPETLNPSLFEGITRLAYLMAARLSDEQL
ncbi:M20/M25/M40 family metallo-hydrolase [bacterium]|nr:M20/M25/M40 family metallo-hydrolase [candidate division CSSED10-310 bacterium]